MIRLGDVQATQVREALSTPENHAIVAFVDVARCPTLALPFLCAEGCRGCAALALLVPAGTADSGCERHAGDPHNLCQACWAAEGAPAWTGDNECAVGGTVFGACYPAMGQLCSRCNAFAMEHLHEVPPWPDMAGTADPERDALEACAEALGDLVPLDAETERDIHANAGRPDAALTRLGCTHGEVRAARRALSRLRAVRGAAGSGAGGETA